MKAIDYVDLPNVLIREQNFSNECQTTQTSPHLLSDKIRVTRHAGGAYSSSNSKLAFLKDPNNRTALDQLTANIQNRESMRGSCEMPRLYLRRRYAVSKAKYNSNYFKREGRDKRSQPDNNYCPIQDQRQPQEPLGLSFRDVEDSDYIMSHRPFMQSSHNHNQHTWRQNVNDHKLKKILKQIEPFQSQESPIPRNKQKVPTKLQMQRSSIASQDAKGIRESISASREPNSIVRESNNGTMT